MMEMTEIQELVHDRLTDIRIICHRIMGRAENGAAQRWEELGEADLEVLTRLVEVLEALENALQDDDVARSLRSQAASLMGRAKTERKAAAARENGAKGGRPARKAS